MRGILTGTTLPAEHVSEIRPGIDPHSQSIQSVRDIHKTDLYTMFTTAIGETREFYSAQSWVKITLRLETAGPVAVSTREQLLPVLSGLGTLLSDEDLVFVLSKGNRLYYAAEAVNRIRVVIEPIAYGTEITRNQTHGTIDIVKTLVNGFNGLGAAMGRVRQQLQAPPQSGVIRNRGRR